MVYRNADEDAGIWAARRAAARRVELEERLAAARAERDRLGEVMADGALRANREEEEVARLDGVGPRAILAKLTGRHAEARAREAAEADAALRAYHDHREDFQRAAARVAELEGELAAMGDVEGQMESALAAYADAIRERGGAPAEALAALEADLDELRDRDGQLAEAILCGTEASERVVAIAHELATPRGGDGQAYSRGRHFAVGPDLPAARRALADFAVALRRLPPTLVGRPLPGIPELDPAWTPHYTWWSDAAARRAFEQISAAVTDALVILEERRQALGREVSALAERWREMVARS